MKRMARSHLLIVILGGVFTLVIVVLAYRSANAQEIHETGLKNAVRSHTAQLRDDTSLLIVDANGDGRIDYVRVEGGQLVEMSRSTPWWDTAVLASAVGLLAFVAGRIGRSDRSSRDDSQ